MGERRNISLDRGIKRSPSLGSDGDLSECINMIPRGGEMVPIAPPEEVGSYKYDNNRLVAIHAFDDKMKYISLSIGSTEMTVYYTDSPEENMEPTAANTIDTLPVSRDTYYGIKTLGRTLMVMMQDGIHYYLYKYGSAEGYKKLGTRIPEINLSFGLKLVCDVVQDETKIHLTDNYISSIGPIESSLSASDRPVVNGKIMALRNKAVKEAMDEGFFLFPFLVRYAVQLKDGTSVIYHSAPVLMIPCTDNAYCYLSSATTIDGYARIMLIKGKLDVLLRDKATEVYADWADVVQGVNIYISEPFYTYYQNEEYTKINQSFGPHAEDEITSYGGICYGFLSAGNDMRYETLRAVECMAKSGKLDRIGMNAGYLPNPKKDIDSEIRECNTFYLLKSLSLKELDDFWSDEEQGNTTISRKDLAISRFRLTNITSQKLLKGEPSHDRLIPTVGYVYNSRLHIAGCYRETVNPHPLWAMVPYMEGTGRKVKVYQSGTTSSYSEVSPVKTDGYYNQSQIGIYDTKGYRMVIYEPNTSHLKINTTSLRYIAFANTDVSAIHIWKSETEGKEIPMQHSMTTSVSFAFDGIEDELEPMEVEEPPQPVQLRIREEYIYSSEVGYPFFFDENTQYAAGSGRILALSSATKAITTGQFGDFPMIVFATDGVWAMSVQSDGTMSAPQPISRDICINPDAILQTDKEVVFVSNQGMMSVSGQVVSLLSAIIEGRNLSEELLNFGTILNEGEDKTWSGLAVSDGEDIRADLKSCVTLYDYANRLIHIYRTTGNKHYVLSTDDAQWASEIWGDEWSELNSTIHCVHAYPSSLVQANRKLFRYKETVYEDSYPAMLVTRPIGFGDLYSHKTLEDVRVYRDTETCKLLLFASNDRRHWTRLRSLNGMAFKFFMFGVLTKMRFGDSLSGIAVMVQFRRTHKLR